MNGNQFSYGCTALMGTNKAGVLKPNSKGYFPVVLGAFNAFNSIEQFYPVEPALELFAPDSALMRRIKNGALRGELGHPRKLPGMTDRDFLIRLADIVEQNVCVHIASIQLVPHGMRDEQGRPITGVIGEIKPAGPHAASLQASLDNPQENVCFSIRSITNDRFERGRYNKYLRAVYTWDNVNEPGMNIAKKWHSPALESLQEAVVDEAGMRSMAREAERSRSVRTGLESAGDATLRRVMHDLGLTEKPEPKRTIILPGSSRW